MIRNTSPPDTAKDWTFSAGVYTPRQIVFLISPLLETVIAKLGVDVQGTVSSRKILVGGLSDLLSTVTAESTMPIPQSTTDASRREVARQCYKIANTLTQYVEELSGSRIDNNVRVQSHGEGYLWTDAVASLLRGPRGNRQLIQLYNEWLHQMVLLRDSLLPFQNYFDVRFSVRCGKGPGMRDFEEPRSKFLIKCLTRTVSQTALVDLAKVFTAPDLPPGGYGLQYSHGLILPAFLSGSNSLHLLRFHSAYLNATVAKAGSDILFEYEYADYPSAPRSEVCDPVEIIPPNRWASSLSTLIKVEIKECALSVENLNGNRCLLKLSLSLSESVQVSIDLGQIARGRRYAYQKIETSRSPTESPIMGFSTPFSLCNPTAILSQPGLVTSQDSGIFLVPAANPVIGLALLGKLYPDNVVMLGGKQAPAVAEAIGKNYGPKFVLFGGDFQNELLCPLQEVEDRFIRI